MTKATMVCWNFSLAYCLVLLLLLSLHVVTLLCVCVCVHFFSFCPLLSLLFWLLNSAICCAVCLWFHAKSAKSGLVSEEGGAQLLHNSKFFSIWFLLLFCSIHHLRLLLLSTFSHLHFYDVCHWYYCNCCCRCCYSCSMHVI